MNLQLGVSKQANNGFWMELCSNIPLSQGRVEHSDNPVAVERDQLACFLWDILMLVEGVQTVKINGHTLAIWRTSTDIPWHRIIPKVEECTRRYCIATGRVHPL